MSARPARRTVSTSSEKGGYDLAIQDLDKAIQLKPDDEKPYYNTQEYDRAIQDYDKAIELNPKDANVFLNRGRCYAANGAHEQAIHDYD